MSSDNIQIDTDKLDEISQQLSRLSSSFASIESNIGSISLTARLVVPEQPSVISSINSLKNRVSASAMYAKRLSNAVGQASAQWAAAENSVVGDLGEGEDPFSEGGAASSEKGFLDYFLSMLQKAIGGTGVFGKIISAIWSGVEKGNVKDWLKSGIDILGALGKVVQEGLKGTKADWAKTIFGIGEYTKTAGEAAKGALGPISWITNGLKAIVDNWDYWENGNKARFFTESVTETVVNVGLGVAAAAGVAAAVAALGISAPAWAVGAVGAIAVWGVNEISKALWDGKTIAQGVGEIVGDFTDYVAEHKDEIIDSVTGAVDWVADKAEEVTDWVADKGKQLLDTGAEIISDVKDTVCNWFSWAIA